MRRSVPVIFLFLLSFIYCPLTYAQLALIKDPDGFSNIRERADIKSKIQDTLSNGRLVYILPEDNVSNWLSIDYNKGENHFSGYIHKSRIVPLHALAPFKATIVKDTLLKLELNDMQITIKAGQFVKTGRKIIFERSTDEYKIVKTIDGKHPWGSDFMPMEEYKFIQFRSGAQTLTFPKTRYNDLFSPNLNNTLAFFDKAMNSVYIIADNGDASLSYTLVWVIRNGQIAHREVFAPF